MRCLRLRLLGRRLTTRTMMSAGPVFAHVAPDGTFTAYCAADCALIAAARQRGDDRVQLNRVHLADGTTLRFEVRFQSRPQSSTQGSHASRLVQVNLDSNNMREVVEVRPAPVASAPPPTVGAVAAAAVDEVPKAAQAVAEARVDMDIDMETAGDFATAQEQEDASLALALQLQEQENRRAWEQQRQVEQQRLGRLDKLHKGHGGKIGQQQQGQRHQLVRRAQAIRVAWLFLRLSCFLARGPPCVASRRNRSSMARSAFSFRSSRRGGRFASSCGRKSSSPSSQPTSP